MSIPIIHKENAVFLRKDNKQMLWDLMLNSDYFSGLSQNSYSRVVGMFDQVMNKVYESNSKYDTVTLNKLFLVEMKPQINALREHNGNPFHLHAERNRNMLKRKTETTSIPDKNPDKNMDGKKVNANRLKSEYSEDLHAKAKRHEDDMLELLIPKIPPAIDFTTHQPYNPAVDKAREKMESVVTESNIEALLNEKMKSRDDSLVSSSSSPDSKYLSTDGDKRKKIHETDALVVEYDMGVEAATEMTQGPYVSWKDKPSQEKTSPLTEESTTQLSSLYPLNEFKEPLHKAKTAEVVELVERSEVEMGVERVDIGVHVRNHVSASPTAAKNNVRFNQHDTIIQDSPNRMANMDSDSIRFLLQEQRNTNKLLEKNNELLQQLIQKID